MSRLVTILAIAASAGARPLAPEDLVEIRLLGHVPAGRPDDVQRDHEQAVALFLDPDVRRWLDQHVRRPQALIAVGDSMEPEINSGDVVIFDPDARAMSGSVVVALAWGEPTVKKLIRQDRQAILRSTGPGRYPDIVLTNAENAVVQGVVVMVVPPLKPRFLIPVRISKQGDDDF